jgi:dTMP kinase
MSLFDAAESVNRQQAQPLAARMRPRTLEEFVGQRHFLGEGKLLRRLLAADRLGSVIFYGPPGTGKTTLARLLADALRARRIEPILTREPGGSPFAEQVRQLVLDPAIAPHSALSEALLFYAARADHVEKVIRPALVAGRWVICDRFSDSTRVYQVEAGGLPLEVFKALELIVVKLTYPDLTLILDIPAQVGLGRATTRRLARAIAGEDADAFEKRDLEYHERLRQGFLDVAKTEPRRCKVIDGTAPPEKVAAEVWAHVERRMLPPRQG